jgi:branched-chain amino acid transport system substrate-binding protein
MQLRHRAAQRLAALLLPVLLLVGASASSAAPEPFEINVMLPLTGPVAVLGKTFAFSLSILEQQVNATNGIGGRPLKFVIQDDQSNPQITLQLINGLIAKGVALIIGPSASANCNAILPLLKDGPVDFCLSPGLHTEKGSYAFSAIPSTLDLGIVTARYARYRGWKKMAFIYTTDGSGRDGEQMVTQAFGLPEFKGVSIVDVEHYAVGDISVSAQMARIKASGADALYIWATGTPSGTALRAAADAGLELPILTSYANATPDQMRAYKTFLPKELLFPGVPTLAAEQLPKGRLRDQVFAYFHAFEVLGAKADIGNPGAYDAGMLAVNAFRKLGTNATAPQIRDYLANLRGYVGVVGTFDFQAVPQRGVNYKSSLIMSRWDPVKETWVGVAPLGD